MEINTEKIIHEFKMFSKYPHRSGNEGQVGKYLVSWAEKHGLHCEKDIYGNVIMEKEGTEGYEKKPTVILQSHMDMVCVAESGKEYDPDRDSITIYEEDGFLKAEGTSLGADDGAGVAMILYILSDNTLKHPPLRAIFTVEEETSMKGAANLDVKYLEAKYLINLDWEEKDSISSSCANTLEINFDSPVKRVKNDKKAYEIIISNLLGGHSGCDINTPRANAVKLAANLMGKMEKEGFELGISLFDGGAARNAIPSEARFVICTNSEENVVKKLAEEFKNEIIGEYPIEKNVVISVKQSESDTAADKEDTSRFIMFLNALHSGVFYMSKYTPDFVETSQNIGVVKLDDSFMHIAVLSRSSSKFHSEERKDALYAMAKAFGYECSFPSENPIWEEKGENELIRIMKKAYNETTGKELKVEGVHAGLECAFFASVKPDVQMVSAGPQLYDVHTPKERWEISSLGETMEFITKALESM